MSDRDTWQYQGRQEHGWFGSGTVPQADSASTSSATPDAGALRPPYIAADPTAFVGHGQVGNGECVALVRRAAGAPLSSSWRAGEPVESGAVPVGTAVATIDPDGHYGNHTDGTSHAAIVTEWTPLGFWGLEQYNIRDANGQVIHSVPPGVHFYEFGHIGRSPIDNGSNYRVIR